MPLLQVAPQPATYPRAGSPAREREAGGASTAPAAGTERALPRRSCAPKVAGHLRSASKQHWHRTTCACSHLLRVSVQRWQLALHLCSLDRVARRLSGAPLPPFRAGRLAREREADGAAMLSRPAQVDYSVLLSRLEVGRPPPMDAVQRWHARRTSCRSSRRRTFASNRGVLSGISGPHSAC